jgi:arsenate reductase
MTDSPIRILFLCTGNSARSIMAECIANSRPDLFAWSAGSRPKGAPNPLALETLAGHGIDASSARSEHWDVYRDERFDVVVTLCGSAAREACPVFPGAPVTVHWGFPDPPAAADPAAEFERVFRGIADAIGRFAADDDPDVAARAQRVADSVRAAFPEAASVGSDGYDVSP